MNIVNGVLIVWLYLTINKFVKGHYFDTFISSGIKKESDRFLFATVILIAALWGAQDKIVGVEGFALLLSALGVCVWDTKQTLHYICAFGFGIVCIYIQFTTARDTVDWFIALSCITMITLGVLAGMDTKFDSFTSYVEHLAFFLASLTFLKMKYPRLKF